MVLSLNFPIIQGQQLFQKPREKLIYKSRSVRKQLGKYSKIYLKHSNLGRGNAWKSQWLQINRQMDRLVTGHTALTDNMSDLTLSMRQTSAKN